MVATCVALRCSLLRKKSICQLCGLSRRADFVLITNQNVSELSATGFYCQRNGSKFKWWIHVLYRCLSLRDENKCGYDCSLF